MKSELDKINELINLLYVMINDSNVIDTPFLSERAKQLYSKNNISTDKFYWSCFWNRDLRYIFSPYEVGALRILKHMLEAIKIDLRKSQGK